MKFSKLQALVTKHAKELQLDAAYGGSMSDGGCGRVLYKLETFRDKLVYQLDLRPSEYYKLDKVEVGEPDEFYDILIKEKRRLAESIKL